MTMHEDATTPEPQGTEQADPEQASTKRADQEPQGTGQPEDKPAEKPADDAEELSRWKSHSRKHEDRAKALATENDDLKKQLETLKPAAGRVDDLEASVTAAEKRAERAELAAEVASAKGVKLRYLTGTTREELEASADEVLEDVRSMSKVGVVPTQGTGDSAPRVTSFASGVERARAQHETP